jgi:hypothetical protein
MLIARHLVVALAFFSLTFYSACAIETGGTQDDNGAGPVDSESTTDQDIGTGDVAGDDDVIPDQPTCQDECEQAGARDCTDNGYRECGEYDDDECLDWSEVTACPDGQGCYNGQCGIECNDECTTVDEKQCVFGVEAFEVCGDYNGDTCLEWGKQVPCEADQVCQEGTCICTDECTAGQKRCVDGDTASETCNDHDGDGCTEWGGRTDCAANQQCHQISGACVRPYPDPPYGVWVGDTIANECLDRVECDGPIPTGTVNFCFDELLDKTAKLVTIHTGW